MIKVQYLGMSPEEIEGFPKGKRTFKGALHLKPHKVYKLSKEEYAFLKKLRPKLKFFEFKEEKKFEKKAQVKSQTKPQVTTMKVFDSKGERKKK